jgi:hypothetical protein
MGIDLTDFYQITEKIISEKNPNNRIMPDILIENKIDKVKNILLHLWDSDSVVPGGAILTLYTLKKKANNENMKNIFNVLLSISNVILPSAHPRQLFITAWLLMPSNKNDNITDKDDRNDVKNVNKKDMNDNYGMRKNLSLKNKKQNQEGPRIRLDARVIDLFFNERKGAINEETDEDDSFFSSGLPIIETVVEWLETRMSAILLIQEGSDSMIKGVAVSNLILKWAGLNVADVLLAPMGFSTIAGQIYTTADVKDDKNQETNGNSIATTGAAIAVNVLDWFDNKLSSFFTPVPPSISTAETSPNTAVPPKMTSVNLTALLDKLFKYQSSHENSAKKTFHSYSDYPLIIADLLESIAQRLVSVHIQDSFNVKGTEIRTGTIVPSPPIGDEISNETNTPIWTDVPIDSEEQGGRKAVNISSRVPKEKGVIIVANVPVRIDLAGGWSDTPPICYQTEGAVLNVAVRVDSRPPISCVARIIEDPVIILRSLTIRNKDISKDHNGYKENKKDINESILEFETHPMQMNIDQEDENSIISSNYEGDTIICNNGSDFLNLNDPSSPCVLLKAVFTVLGIVNVHDNKINENKDDNNKLFLELLDRFCGGGGRGYGLEVACCSELPSGSGELSLHKYKYIHINLHVYAYIYLQIFY